MVKLYHEIIIETISWGNFGSTTFFNPKENVAEPRNSILENIGKLHVSSHFSKDQLSKSLIRDLKNSAKSHDSGKIVGKPRYALTLTILERKDVLLHYLSIFL